MRSNIFSSINKKISLKLSFAIIISVAFILLVFMYYESSIRLKEDENELIAKVNTLSALASESFSDPLWSYNNAGVEVIARGLLIDSEIAGIEVFDRADPYYSYFKTSHEYDKDFVFTSTINIQRQGLLLGHVNIAFTKYFIQQKFKKEILDRLIQIVVLVVFLVFVISIISLRITRPIKQLSFRADEIASGDLTKRIEVTSEDEIGELALKFNNMAAALQTAYKDLEDDAIELEIKNEEIQKYSENLEGLVKERTCAYNKANTDLLQKNEELKNAIQTLHDTQKHLIQHEKLASLGSLVAGVSHEVNTPLGVGISTISYLEKINNDFRSKLAQGQVGKNDLKTFIESLDDSIAIISINLTKAADLIKNFKRVAVDQSNDIKTEFFLKDNIEAVFISMKHEYKKARHQLTNDCPYWIKLNSYPGDFSQIFTNFVANSLKHGFREKEDGNISISASLEDTMLRIVYTDDGAGINEDIINKVFDPFFTTDRQGGSSGLGLNIVYNIVSQKLRGNINCESIPGKGVKFVIEIPRKNVL